MYVDDVLKKVMKRLGLEIPEYSYDFDPTKLEDTFIDWTFSEQIIKEYKKMYNERLRTAVKKRRLNKIKPEDKDEKEAIKTILVPKEINEINCETAGEITQNCSIITIKNEVNVDVAVKNE